MALQFEEKPTEVSTLVSGAVPISNFAGSLGPLGEVPVAKSLCQRPMLIAVGASILVTNALAEPLRCLTSLA